MTTNTAPPVQTDAALTGILALLVADREERRGPEHRRADTILARAGIDDDQVAAIVGADAGHTHPTLDHDANAVRPGRVESVIDRARAHLTARASTA